MVRVKRQPTRKSIKARSDLSPKAQPSKTPRKPESEDHKAYQRWIKSHKFRELRERMLERDNWRCRFCGRTMEEIADNPKITLQAHHIRYDNCGKGNDEELDDLITACSVCHRSMHSAKSNLSRFKDKSKVIQNLKLYNPDCL